MAITNGIADPGNALALSVRLWKAIAIARTLSIVALGMLVAAVASASGQTREIVVYGQNAPSWNQQMGVTATRGTCNLSPEACMKTVETLLQQQHTSHFYLNLIADPETVLNYASQYSNASIAEPRLYEITLDDFPDHFNAWCRTPGVKAGALLSEVIKRTKSRNPRLRFGVTIYEDQISGLLANPAFTLELRSRIDTVHLFVHYRANGPRFETYVRRIKQDFPNASVIAGSYPYDRIDYRTCAPASHAHCSTAQELELFKQTLNIQVRMLQLGVVSGIEFYPGFFGWEENYGGWADPNQCLSRRKQDCIDNTKAMHQAVLQILAGARVKPVQ